MNLTGHELWDINAPFTGDTTGFTHEDGQSYWGFSFDDFADADWILNHWRDYGDLFGGGGKPIDDKDETTTPSTPNNHTTDPVLPGTWTHENGGIVLPKPKTPQQAGLGKGLVIAAIAALLFSIKK